MSDKADRAAAPRQSTRASEFVSYGLIAGAVLLGWQITIQPLIQRAPAEIAIGLAPGSPMVLRRAAEAELGAGRVDNAAALGRDALARSPFDVRALRIVGLTEARTGREDQADEILTLAGNWSLRDDPAHAWLVERRLRRGDYASAFAHADTLVRRRQDIQPQVFRLFTVAGSEDPGRAAPVLARLLAARPPWRDAYLSSLSRTEKDLQLSIVLAVMLESGQAPLTSEELYRLYWYLLEQGRLEALSAVRRRLDRPPADVAVTNGGFGDDGAPAPFQWKLFQKAGVVAEIVPDDLRPANAALRVDYDGYAAGPVAEQLTTLPPGSYQLVAETRTEAGDAASRLVWTVYCVNGERAVASVPVPDAGGQTWTSMSGQLEVPDNCPAQWLRLDTRAGDRRAASVRWFDRITISPAG